MLSTADDAVHRIWSQVTLLHNTHSSLFCDTQATPTLATQRFPGYPIPRQGGQKERPPHLVPSRQEVVISAVVYPHYGNGFSLLYATPPPTLIHTAHTPPPPPAADTSAGLSYAPPTPHSPLRLAPLYPAITPLTLRYHLYTSPLPLFACIVYTLSQADCSLSLSLSYTPTHQTYTLYSWRPLLPFLANNTHDPLVSSLSKVYFYLVLYPLIAQNQTHTSMLFITILIQTFTSKRPPISSLNLHFTSFLPSAISHQNYILNCLYKTRAPFLRKSQTRQYSSHSPVTVKITDVKLVTFSTIIVTYY